MRKNQRAKICRQSEHPAPSENPKGIRSSLRRQKGKKRPTAHTFFLQSPQLVRDPVTQANKKTKNSQEIYPCLHREGVCDPVRPRLHSSRARVFPSAPPASLSYTRRLYSAWPRAPLGRASPGCSGARPRAAHPTRPRAAVRPKRPRSDPTQRLAPLPLHLRYYPLLRSLLLLCSWDPQSRDQLAETHNPNPQICLWRCL